MHVAIGLLRDAWTLDGASKHGANALRISNVASAFLSRQV
jgi:hypothetical protein